MTLLKPKIFLLLIFPLAIFLSFNKHSKDKINTYHGVLWADAAGYYVYQPIWFIYGNNARNFPDNIDLVPVSVADNTRESVVSVLLLNTLHTMDLYSL